MGWDKLQEEINEHPERPPLGIIPKWMHVERRYCDIAAAIVRYVNAGLPIQNDWISEYNELAKWLNERR